MYLTLTIVLGLAYAVSARDCLKPSFVEDFSMKKFEGDWQFVGHFAGDKTEADLYRNVTCANQGFKIKNEGIYDAYISYYIGAKQFKLVGTYAAADPTKAEFIGKFKLLEPLVYNFRVVCTDYTKWAVGYSCAPIEPEHISDHVFLLAKDNTTYDELISAKEVTNCIKEIVKTPAEQLRKIMFNNCPNKTT